MWSWRQNKASHSARSIQSIARDYDENLNRYCDEYLERWPEHSSLVDRWRADIRHYLFWALAYGVALHFRNAASRAETSEARSLFEIMDYRLSAEEFRSAVSQMKMFRTGATESAAYAVVTTLIRLGLTRPVGWVSQHQAALRAVLGLK